MGEAAKRTVPFVDLTRLSAAERAQYKNFFSKLDFDESIKVDEVVSSMTDDIMGHIYYARYDGGIIRGFAAEPFELKYPDLVADYEKKKKNGTLKPFDPTSQQVHPHWRPTFRLTLNKKKRRASVSLSSAHGSQYGSQSESELEDVTSDDNYSNGERGVTRRSTRQKVRQSTLPFSPRKTRSRVVYPILDSDDEGESSDASMAVRRSRRVKPTKILLDEDEISSGSESDEYVERNSRSKTSKGKGKGKAGKVSTIPEYGLFRSIDELDEDPDPDTKELRAHWSMCGKCHGIPAHLMLEKEIKKAKRGKKRKQISDDEFEEEDGVERLKAKGGWVRCLNCPVNVHWSCLSRADQEEILRAARERDRNEWLKIHDGEGLDVEKDGPRKRPGLDIDEMTDFVCNYCSKSGFCLGCLDPIPAQSSRKPQPTVVEPEASKDADGDVQMRAASSTEPPHRDISIQLLFRCFTCKRTAHYQHIQDDIAPDDDLAAIASHYQSNWLCRDCASYQWNLDKILAWRPYPEHAQQPPDPLNIKEPLPREYLVKWQERGYKRTEWVPHMWLVSTAFAKLKNFIANGTKVELLGEDSDDKLVEEEPTGLFDVGSERSERNTPKPMQTSYSALVDAEDRIPVGWRTVERVLDVQLRFSSHEQPKKKTKKNRRVVQSEGEESEPEEAKEAFEAAYERGEEPAGFVESVDDFERRTGVAFDPEQHSGLVIWAFFKWVDLGYEESTWDAPPLADDPTYPAFEAALKRYSAAREVQIEKLSKAKLDAFLRRDKRRAKTLKDADELDLGQDPKLRLMPFQVDGFNWLCENWWNQQPCILADEMGLGKTVQITSFIGHIAKNWNAMPALVVVPNSTITNWVREFERWAPNLRVVPFYGDAKARDVIKRFELRHSEIASGTTGAKFHVLVTTYEGVINPKEFGTVFKGQPRWEILVIDEGQRLKSDSSLLFRKLSELNTGHRIIMTGTPLNNNIRELFNLMHFLEPEKWDDLPALEREYAELDEDLIKKLHNRLRPYFLRRIKSEVLDLPPKNEIIVPVTMSSLQKEVYRSILSHNLELLQTLMRPSGARSNAKKATINNMLMQLRKCLQHPYLYDEDIEPRGLTQEETHDKLIGASAKLRLLKDLLPKLKARGHRVLIFSQFVIALNIIEDFLVGEGLKFLRLDGNTKGTERQKGMDEFNRPGSDVFIYLLTTRAGGVGINLFTADTVIIFDPDFNPHQDLQAIARAHRFGQKKTCLVFKLMVKDSAEERIMQIGKKKLVLDHLIVQKMDDDDQSAGENVQSILTYGAQQLFDETAENNSKDIIYSEADIDNLIDKTEKEGEEESAPKEGNAFSFAKIWTADKDELEDMADDDQFKVDSWSQTLEKINQEVAKKQAQEEEDLERAGRRARRKTATTINYALDFDSPRKNARHRESDAESAYGSERTSEVSDTSDSEGEAEDLKELSGKDNKRKSKYAVAESANPVSSSAACGLCGRVHGPRNCPMTESSANLVEYREMLISHADDESYDERCAAVNSIDEALHRRGEVHLIFGKPLYPVKAPQNKVAAAVSKPLPQSVSVPAKATASSVKSTALTTGLLKASVGSSASTSGFVKASTATSTSVSTRPSGSGPSAPASIPFGPSSSTSASAKTTASSGLSSKAPVKANTSAQASTSGSSSAAPINGSRSPGKRAASPSPAEPSSKKQQLEVCAVCDQTPLHKLRDCPVVSGDLPTLFKTIQRLQKVPEMAHVAEILRKYADQRQKK